MRGEVLEIIVAERLKINILGFNFTGICGVTDFPYEGFIKNGFLKQNAIQLRCQEFYVDWSGLYETFNGFQLY